MIKLILAVTILIISGCASLADSSGNTVTVTFFGGDTLEKIAEAKSCSDN